MSVPGNAADPDAAFLAEDLRRAVGVFVRAVRDATDGRSAQAETLSLLDHQGPMSVATLSQARNVTHQTMRLVVAQLEAAGMVCRAPNPADRRGHLVSISEAGRAETMRGRHTRASRIEEIIRNTLSRDDRAVLRAGIMLLDRLSAASGPSPV